MSGLLTPPPTPKALPAIPYYPSCLIWPEMPNKLHKGPPISIYCLDFVSGMNMVHDVCDFAFSSFNSLFDCLLKEYFTIPTNLRTISSKEWLYVHPWTNEKTPVFYKDKAMGLRECKRKVDLLWLELYEGRFSDFHIDLDYFWRDDTRIDFTISFPLTHISVANKVNFIADLIKAVHKEWCIIQYYQCM